MKAHVVREQFSLEGKDYPRGTLIEDHALLTRIKATHGHHMIAQHHDIAEPTPSPVREPSAPVAVPVAKAAPPTSPSASA